jgi:hypothetical protein
VKKVTTSSFSGFSSQQLICFIPGWC